MKNVTFKIDLFEKIVNRSYEAIIIINELRQIVFWNQAAEKIFGFTADMVVGRDMHSLITPERYRQVANQSHRNYIKTGEGKVLGKRIEVEALNCMGQEFWVELSVNDVMVDGQRWAFAIIRDISDRKKMEKMLEHQAQTDPLSGLHNRRAFQYYLDNSIEGGISVAFIDGDDFKKINDNFGHDAGDQVVSAISLCVKRTFGDAVCNARVGGDEFAVILAETNKDRLRERYKELQDDIGDTIGRVIDYENFSVSIGVVGDASGKADPRTLLTMADKALYESKSSGRGRITIKDYFPTGI